MITVDLGRRNVSHTNDAQRTEPGLFSLRRTLSSSQHTCRTPLWNDVALIVLEE